MKKLLKAFLGLAFTAFFVSCNIQPDATNDILPEFDLTGYSSTISKRGICYNSLNNTSLNLMAKGYVRWAYNWGYNSENTKVGPSGYVNYYPMVWGSGAAGKDSEIRSYLDSNPGIEYILGFNEPNMDMGNGGSYMLPSEAAKLWPTIEKIASDYNLKLVGPAMTYSGATLSDGKVYGNPETWFDEFVTEYKNLYNKEPSYDYFCIHSYMIWPSPVAEMIEKYYNLYKKPVFLTEFCAWEYGDNQWTDIGKAMAADDSFQRRTMIQKLYYMDHSDMVAGYAWFMADGNAGSVPYNRLYNGKKLTELGKAYSYMSNGDTSKYYSAGKGIPAVQFTSSCLYDSSSSKPWDNYFVVSENTDESSSSDIPAAITGFTSGKWAEYQINIEEAGDYELTLRYAAEGKESISVIVGGKTLASDMFTTTSKKWQNKVISPVKLSKGKQTLKLSSSGSASDVQLAWLYLQKIE